jgi:hypothetical protein
MVGVALSTRLARADNSRAVPSPAQGVQNAKLTAPRCSSTAIGEIDDLSLPDSIDGGVGFFDKTLPPCSMQSTSAAPKAAL